MRYLAVTPFGLRLAAARSKTHQRTRPSAHSSGSAQHATEPTRQTSRAHGEIPSGMRLWACVGVLGLLVLAMFGDLLFAGGSRVLGSQTTDMLLQFVAWRDFGFRELANGNYALWNPHIYGGAPYAGGMQAALLYPINWLFMVLPLPQAMNWTIALNVWLIGSFMFLWAVRRGLHPVASLVAGALLMFCAPHFLHIHAGHVTNLPAMTWAPLVFLALDEWIESRHAVWCLTGMFAVAMQVFAGHPQYVFYTAITAGLYLVFRLAASGRSLTSRATIAAGFGSMYVGGALLSAVQLLVGMQAGAETIRNEALPWEFASMFAFPPENLLTLLAPSVFGNMAEIPYWGRAYLWEVSLFMGVTGLVAAVYGIFVRETRGRWALLAVVGVTLLLAFGKYTPLFRLLYDFVPGFDRFRSVSKFVFPCMVFLTMFSAIGFDRLIRSDRVGRRAIVITASAGGMLGAMALVVRRWEWQEPFEMLASFRESYLSREHYEQLLLAHPMTWASNMLGVAALTLVVLAALFHFRHRVPRLAYVVCLLAVGEVFVFARMNRPSFDSEAAAPASFRAATRQAPADSRIMNLYIPNSAMLFDAYDAWGFDPSVVRRYAELLHWTQFRPTVEQPRFDRTTVTQYLQLIQMHPLLSLVRLHAVLVPQPDGSVRTVPAMRPPLARLTLMTDYRLANGFEQITATLMDSTFDPMRQVVLEEVPSPAPSPESQTSPGTVSIVREDTDEIELVAELSSPALLVMTDAWTPAWRARALDSGDSREYRVLPANHALRAIPLTAGKHHILLEYAPWEFTAGMWISMLSWLAFAAMLPLISRKDSFDGFAM